MQCNIAVHSDVVKHYPKQRVVLIQGGGKFSESEILLKVTQRNLNVERVGQ